MEREDNFSTLLRMACSRMDTVDAGFEERIMLEMMNRVVTKTRRRNKVSLGLSLCSAAAIFACSVFLIMHFLPARIFVSKSLNIDTLIDKLPRCVDNHSGGRMAW